MDELESSPGQPPQPSDPVSKYTSRSILVKEVNWLGDLVMSLPALRAIRRAYPLARLSVLVKSGLAGFFDGIDWLDEVISYPDQPRSLKHKLNIVRDIRSREFDLAILFPNSFESALWVMLAGIPRRAGYATDARGFLLTDRVNPSDDALTRHQSRYWLGMLRDTLGIPIGEEAPYCGLGYQRPPSRSDAFMAETTSCSPRLTADCARPDRGLRTGQGMAARSIRLFNRSARA